MQQIKLFVGSEDAAGELEAEVNGWIASSGAAVISISANIAPQSTLAGKDAAAMSTPGRRFAASDLLVMVTYEKA
ncbi:MAG: hypothetical protein ACPGYV_04520 [Phycisphaeraceae bacterium]